MNRSWQALRLRERGRMRAAALVAACVVSLMGPVQAASATGEPSLATPVATLDAALHCPATFAHPEREPVLLVHGITSTYEESWSWGFAPALRGAGFDVCGVDLPDRALVDIQVSTEYVVRAIDRISAATGRKVDVVAHSEGNMQTRWALKWWPHLQDKVDDYVGLAGPNHGVVGGNVACAIPCAAAGTQMSVGANFLDALNRDDETPGNVSYTQIYSRSDEIMVPFTTVPLRGARNIAVQDVCFGRLVTHFGALYDSVVYRLLVDALSHPGAADPSRLPFGKCLDAYAPGISAVDVTVATADILAHADLAALGSFFAGDFVWGEPPLKPYVG